MNGSDTRSLELKELVQRFRVCWKVWPEYQYVKDEKRQIGYQLELAGTHEPWVDDQGPGCEHCQRIYTALRQIAEWILPRERRPSMYEIGAFDRSIRYWSLHERRPDVILTVTILHREGSERAVDECEDRCLEEMEADLTTIGACRLRWTTQDESVEKWRLKEMEPRLRDIASQKDQGHAEPLRLIPQPREYLPERKP